MTNQTFNQLYQETLKKNSEEIKKFLKDFYPQRSDFFDTLNFKFIEQQASLDGSLPLYVDMITNKRTIRVNVKDVSPLYVDSLIEGLKLERPDMEHKLELFVYFVKDFDPQAISKPPQKKEIQVLLKWFFENVDSDIDVQHIGGERKNGLVLSWYCSNLERKKTGNHTGICHSQRFGFRYFVYGRFAKL